MVPFETVEAHLGEPAVLAIGLDTNACGLIESFSEVRGLTPIDRLTAYQLRANWRVVGRAFAPGPGDRGFLADVADQQFEARCLGRFKVRTSIPSEGMDTTALGTLLPNGSST